MNRVAFTLSILLHAALGAGLWLVPLPSAPPPPQSRAGGGLDAFWVSLDARAAASEQAGSPPAQRSVRPTNLVATARPPSPRSATAPPSRARSTVLPGDAPKHEPVKDEQDPAPPNTSTSTSTSTATSKILDPMKTIEIASPRKPTPPPTSLGPGASARPAAASSGPKSSSSGGRDPEGSAFPDWPGPNDVDQAARPRWPIHPHYPARARRSGAESTVVVEAWVDELGAVAFSSVVESGGVDFDESARRAIHRSSFRPAHRAGQDVASRVALRIHFELYD